MGTILSDTWFWATRALTDYGRTLEAVERALKAGDRVCACRLLRSYDWDSRWALKGPDSEPRVADGTGIAWPPSDNAFILGRVDRKLHQLRKARVDLEAKMPRPLPPPYYDEVEFEAALRMYLGDSFG